MPPLHRAAKRLLRPTLSLSPSSASTSLAYLPRASSAGSARSMHSSVPRLTGLGLGPSAPRGAPIPGSTLRAPAASTVGASGAGAASGAGTGRGGTRPNGYSVLYREIFPAMVPILLISTTIFLSLSLTRTHLSHALSLQESTDRIALLEEELAQLRKDQRRQLARERRERERILPMVVARVLQRVGVRGEEDEEEADEETVVEAPLVGKTEDKLLV